MRIGVVYPQSELGDAASLRTYAEGVDELGFAHLVAYDHVVGADPEVHIGWNGPYDSATTFHEPLVMFGFVAGFTQLELVTGIVILPQRQTALVAKQAAEVDLLSGGRFRLGVGIGWNAVEYEALGKDFHNRGRRLEEQVDLLRRLWTEPSITFDGRYERVTGAGLAPLPVQRPIPVWMGGASEPAFQRIGRIADGWFPMLRPGDELDAALATIATSAEGAGRDPGAIGMEGRVTWTPGDPATFGRRLERWRDLGASHLSIDTMRLGLAGVDEHLAALESAAAVAGLDRR